MESEGDKASATCTMDPNFRENERMHGRDRCI